MFHYKSHSINEQTPNIQSLFKATIWLVKYEPVWGHRSEGERLNSSAVFVFGKIACALCCSID